MSGEFLLDTNIVIALTLGDGAVLDKLENDVTVYLRASSLASFSLGRTGRRESRKTLNA